MVDTEELSLIREVKNDLDSLSTLIRALTIENAEMRVELREVKGRLLGDLVELTGDYRELRATVNDLKDTVAGIAARQAPLSTPAAWGALIISGIVAVKSFFGLG